MFERHCVVTARVLAAERTGNNNAARMPIMAITTSSSTNVNARLTLPQTPEIGICYKLFCQSPLSEGSSPIRRVYRGFPLLAEPVLGAPRDRVNMCPPPPPD